MARSTTARIAALAPAAEPVEAERHRPLDAAGVEAALEALPHAACVEGAVEILKVCADITRMKILLSLRARELCVGDLAAIVGVTESAVSHQLRLLRAAKIVAFRKHERVVFYRLADEHVTTLLQNALEHAHEDHV